MKTPILGSSYVARSVNAADNRMVNLFPEIVPEGGKEPAFLSRCPGLLQVSIDTNNGPSGSAGNGPISGMYVMGGYLYVVSGTRVYEVDSNYDATHIGSVDNAGNLPVSMADNGTQLFIACNGPSYIYNTSTGVFARITDPDFPGAVTVGYLDGFFVFNEPNSQRIWTTQLLDGTSVEPLDFASAEDNPDNVLTIAIAHRELWVFGSESIEVWYNAGNPGFPFSRIQGASIEIGCASPYAVSKTDDTLYWLSGDSRGHGMVYRARGYSPERVSTHAVEWQIQKYGDLSNALAYSYQQDGHTFYMLTFPDHDATWVFDAATNAWHERAGFEDGRFVRHRGNCQAFFDNQVLIGDYENGNIYKYDLNTYSDNGQPQKWLRPWRALPSGTNNLKRSAHHSLQLDCETGVGIVAGQGSDPQVMLRWSDDGGHTWSNERWVSMGKIGEYGRRAIWRRLGMTLKLRDRVYEVSGTDPVKVNIMGAELHVSPTNA